MRKINFTSNLKVGVFLIPLIFFSLNSFSQTSQEKLIGVPDDENRLWLSELESSNDITQQIELIKNKIHLESKTPDSPQNENSSFWENQVKKEDDLLMVSQEAVDEKQKTIKECNCKMEFKVVVKDETYDLDSSKYQYTNPVLSMIEESTIDTVLIKNNFKNNSYLSSGQCGIIYLYSTNNKIARKIKKKL